MPIAEALGLEKARVIAVVGAGGKTSLIEALGREFHQCGERVLATTTTRVAVDEFQGGWRHIADAADARKSLCFLSTGLVAKGQKRSGVVPESIDRLARQGEFKRLIVEADGSRRRPLKVPGPMEPVVPESCDTLIVVMGLSGLGRLLEENTVFRAELWGEMAGGGLGVPITPLDLWQAVTDSRSYGRLFPALERRILFLNQLDATDDKSAPARFAELASSQVHPFNRIVIGSLKPTAALIPIWLDYQANIH
ncbi:MAG: putative selenium-dependent hydroxylase accessory protein YqeC [Rhodospirillales bacterium]|nr:MAG: putative selenium-dependent hydroxylase accessory protein YqeC [Rhodospirillales bacterium]